MKTVLLALLYLTSTAFAELPQQPLTNTKSAEEAAKPDARGTEHVPLVIKVLPPLDEDEKAATEQQEHEDKSKSDWWLVKLTGILAAIGLMQLIAFAIQAHRLRQTVEEMKIATKATLKTAQNMEAADRAYIKISHAEPGLKLTTSTADLLYGGDKDRTYEVHIEVRNIGKTPARMTDLVFTEISNTGNMSLPVNPPYNSSTGREEVRTILYGTDVIYPDHSLTISPTNITEINAGTRHFYLLIYADYIDQFEVRHRAGYARRYDPHTTVNNLFVVTQKDYNYDRPRKPGEGNDWDEANA